MVIFDVLAVALAGAGLYVARQATRQVSELERRVRELEARAKSGQQQIAAASPSVEAPVPAAADRRPPQAISRVPVEPPPSRRPPPPLSRPILPRKPSTFGSFSGTVVEFVKRNPFAFLGVLLVLVSVGFLFTWLAANNVLPPALRIVFVALAGLAVFGGSLRYLDGRSAIASNLQGGALAVQYLCVLWAYQGYELVSPLTAFAALGVVSAAAFGWAILREEGLFAFMGLVGGLLTPAVASTGGGTFEGLTLYTLGVSLLSLGTASRLKMPTLATVSLAGVVLLLASAVRLPSTNPTTAATGLLSLGALYSAIGLYWSVTRREWSHAWLVAVVGLLTGAPLAMEAFLYQKAGFSAHPCAAILAPFVAAYLTGYGLASGSQIRGWLLAIAAALGLVGIGIGLEGTTQALTLSVSALGLVTLAASTKNVWAERGAFVYWCLAVAASLEPFPPSTRTPLLVAGLVGLVAGYFASDSLVRGRVYTAAAPLLLGYATLGNQVWEQPNTVALWFLGWTVVSTLAGLQLNWKELRLSAFWVLPAGFYLLVSALPQSSMESLALREATLIAWLTVSGYLALSEMQRMSKYDPKLPGPVSLLLPIAASVEVVRLMWFFHASVGVQVNALGLLWGLWAAFARAWSGRRTGEDYLADVAGILSGCLLLLATLIGRPSSPAEVMKWLSVVVLLWVTRDGSERAEGYRPHVYGLAGVLALGNVLQLIGLSRGLSEPVLRLLFETAMQPWVSLLWAGGAIATIVFASKTQNREVWSAGGFSVLLLMAKMLFVDLSTFTLLAKVVVFLVTGLAFIGLGFLSPLPPERKKPKGSVGGNSNGV